MKWGVSQTDFGGRGPDCVLELFRNVPCRSFELAEQRDRSDNPAKSGKS